MRQAGELAGLDALVLPGGESTTIAKGLERLGLYEPLERFAAAGNRVLGTCAGAVLLASIGAAVAGLLIFVPRLLSRFAG